MPSENRLGQALALSQHVLAEGTGPAAAVEWAVFGGGVDGTVGVVLAMAKRGCAIEIGVDGSPRYLTAFGDVRALALADELPPRKPVRWICADLVGWPELVEKHQPTMPTCQCYRSGFYEGTRLARWMLTAIPTAGVTLGTASNRPRPGGVTPLLISYRYDLLRLRGPTQSLRSLSYEGCGGRRAQSCTATAVR